MTTPSTAALGVISIAPLLVFMILIAWLPGYAAKVQSTGQEFTPIFTFAKFYIFTGWLITIGAIVIAFNSPHVPQSKRIGWAIALFVFNMFALPVFWYRYIWRPHHARKT